MNNQNKWINGVVLSFDFKVERLESFYDGSYNTAYRDIKNYLLENGFIHLKDSDYINHDIDNEEAIEILKDFIAQHKWFASSIEKLTIAPNVEHLDLTEDIRVFRDIEWEEERLNLHEEEFDIYRRYHE